MQNDAENLFSLHPSDYVRYRPVYPQALYQWLATLVPTPQLALDCATGSGQAASGLAHCFRRVIATDNSERQLGLAKHYKKIDYVAAQAESLPFKSQTFDLITAACAVHWFDRDVFYSEARRVLRPTGVLAVWTYSWPELGEPELDAVLIRLKDEVLGAFWLPQSHLYFNKYRELDFPFISVDPPQFAITLYWNGNDILNFLNTWSIAENYRKIKQEDPMTKVREEFNIIWKKKVSTEYIDFSLPLYLKVGRVM